MPSILTVITPAPTRDLTTLATVKSELGITDSASDARLRRQITGVSGEIEDYTKRVWARETVAETFYRDPDRRAPDPIRLKRWPVTNVASVVVDSVFLIEGTDFLVNPDEGLVYRLNSNFVSVPWCGAITVFTYTGGYDLLGELPSALEEACLLMMKHRHSSQDRDPMLRSVEVPGVQSESYWVGSGSGTDNGNIPPEVRGKLDAWREYRL